MILPDTAADALGEADRSTTRSALIRTIVSPYDDPQHGASSRIEIRGADVAISGRAATGFALLVHEFATNAAKYGALSTEEGRIAIDCAEQDGVYVLLWQERGGSTEEHTSELQSLMRHSYAVFSLTKKNRKN